MINYVFAQKTTEITDVKNLTGEVKIISSNYKKRVGYEIKVSFAYRGLDDNSDCKGHINFTSLSCDGDEEVHLFPSKVIFKFKIKMKGGVNKKDIAKAIYKNMPKFIEKIRETLKLMKDFFG